MKRRKKVSPDVKKALAKQKKELDNKYQSEIESKDKQIAELKKVNNSGSYKIRLDLIYQLLDCIIEIREYLVNLFI